MDCEGTVSRGCSIESNRIFILPVTFITPFKRNKMNEKNLEQEIRKALSAVMHPEVDLSLVDLGIIKDISVNGGTVSITLAFPFPGIPIRDYLIGIVREPVEKLGAEAEINVTTMSEEKLKKFFAMEQDNWKGGM